MEKYKVQIKQTETVTNYYIVDVLAKTEEEAKTEARKKFIDIEICGTQHYYQEGEADYSETFTEVDTIYDVTNTDDPFNP